MQPDANLNPADLGKAFLQYERAVRIRNYRVGCILAFIFMPAGALLDAFVYGADTTKVQHFFYLRCLCSLLLGFIWFLLQSKVGLRCYRFLGLLVALLPLFFICWMIYEEDGSISPYYAGLNLVMLGAAILLRWTLLDSILVFFLCLVSYLVACFLNSDSPVTQAPMSIISRNGIFFNNLYFLVVTGVFIITGSWFYNRIRFREFELRYELDHNRQLLEQSNRKLLELDEVKSRFLRQYQS